MSKKKSWFRLRNYPHFDSPVSYKIANSIVTSPKLVSKHAFYPLINYEIKSHKIFKDENKEVKKKSKIRSISYSSHIDSHIYSYYAWALNNAYEKRISDLGLNNHILAFRSLGKSNIDFADMAFEDVKERKNCSVVALDISGFFDNLDHSLLKKAWASILLEQKLPEDHFNVYKSLTRFSTVDKVNLYKVFNISMNQKSNVKKKKEMPPRICSAIEFRDKVRAQGLITVNKDTFGIPQGSPISALLSNIYMLDFDYSAKRVMEEQGGSYYRYCDDMLFITSSEYKNDIENFAKKQISKLKLSINTDKTEIRDFWIENGMQTCSKPLQYLGFTFDGKRKLIRSAALAKFSNRMNRGVRLAKSTQKKRNGIKKTKGLPPTLLYKRKLYEKYSHLGDSNFITYGHRAAKIMNSDPMRKQLKPLWNRLQKKME